jgi:hypothetical protein
LLSTKALWLRFFMSCEADGVKLENCTQRNAYQFSGIPHFAGGAMAHAERMHERASTINSNPITRKKGDEYVIETKERWNFRAPTNLSPGGDQRGFSRELGA